MKFNQQTIESDKKSLEYKNLIKFQQHEINNKETKIKELYDKLQHYEELVDNKEQEIKNLNFNSKINIKEQESTLERERLN